VWAVTTTPIGGCAQLMTKAQQIYDYAVLPNEGVGPIRFGMEATEVRAAMSPHRAQQRKFNRLLADSFHGEGLLVIYLDRTVHSIRLCSGGDIWGRIELRPRYLRRNGFNLFGYRPAKVLSRLSRDAECDSFVEGHPGSYCAPDLGLVLAYCDFEDFTFSHVTLGTKVYFERYPVQHRVKDIVSRKQRRPT
jgi:hypothetical protein